MIASEFPMAAVGHTLPIALPSSEPALLLSLWTSFVFDYVARQKVGGTHMTYGYLTQLATVLPGTPPPWLGASLEWFVSRARFLQSSRSWLTECREDARAELDAAYFHLFGVARGDVGYIMDTFPIVKRKDEAAFGSYRTKELIVEAFDAMQTAIDTGVPYASPLDSELSASEPGF